MRLVGINNISCIYKLRSCYEASANLLTSPPGMLKECEQLVPGNSTNKC